MKSDTVWEAGAGRVSASRSHRDSPVEAHTGRDPHPQLCDDRAMTRLREVVSPWAFLQRPPCATQGRGEGLFLLQPDAVPSPPLFRTTECPLVI